MRNDTSDRLLRRYIARERVTVWGNLHAVDAACYAALLRFQTASGLAGGAAEIGVSQGRSMILMAKALAPGERVYGIDLFEHDAHARPGTGQLDAFKANAARLGVAFPDDCIRIGASEMVKAEEILKAVGPVRLFSVDGGHRAHHVVHDAALAAGALADHGIIAFDDFCNPEWPEVSMATFDFLRSNDQGFVPFAITKDKLFVCRAAYRERYMAGLADSAWTRGFRLQPVEWQDSSMTWVQHDLIDRVIYHGLERLGLSRLAYLRQERRSY